MEYLKHELFIHKHVLEALSYKMKINNSDDQLSGLGFSNTKRNTLIVKVISNRMERFMRIKF